MEIGQHDGHPGDAIDPGDPAHRHFARQMMQNLADADDVHGARRKGERSTVGEDGDQIGLRRLCLGRLDLRRFVFVPALAGFLLGMAIVFSLRGGWLKKHPTKDSELQSFHIEAMEMVGR